MAKLMDLPVELLQMIATAEVRSGTILRQKDLASLSLANLWLYKVINRILYMYNRKYNNGNLFNYAVKHGNFDTINAATSLRIEPESWHYLLLLACENRRREMITWLLDRGTPLQETSEEILNRWGNGLYIGHFPIRDHRSWERMMIRGCPTLLVSILNGMEDIALLLLSHGANTLFAMDAPPYIRSALHYAACKGMVKVVEYLVQDLGISVDIKDYRGYTPLHFAQKYALTSDDNTEMLETLINLGADVNNEVDGSLPLTSALYEERLRHANILLDAGSKIKPDDPQEDVIYPIHAVMHTRFQKGVMFKDSMQWSLLQRLIDAGADLHEPYIEGHTPLEEAIIVGTPKMMSCVLAMIAEKYGEEPLGQEYIFDFMAEEYLSIVFFNQKVGILMNSGVRMDLPLSDGRSFLSWIFHSGYIRLMQGLVTWAVKSIQNRSHLDDILKELVTDSAYLGQFAHPDHLKILISGGAKLHSAKEIYQAALHCLYHKNLLSNGWAVAILDMGLPTERIPDLITNAIKLGTDSSFVGYLLDLVEPRLWQQYTHWLSDAVNLNYPLTIIEKLLYGMENVDINSILIDGETLLVNTLNDPLLYNVPWTTSILLEHGADPFLPTKYSACNCNSEKYSAFELALHNSSHFRRIAKTLWYRSAPELRPDPKVFLGCVPNIGRSEKYQAKLTKWLKGLSMERKEESSS